MVSRESDLGRWSDARLIRGFSHDVKNPLGAAEGNAALLTSGIYGALSPPQRESVERIRRSIRNALDLIDDLNELACADVHRVPVSFELVDVCDLLSSIVEEYRAVATAGGLALCLDAERDLDIIETDPARLRQIIGNFLSNAIKYTPHGTVTVRIRLRGFTSTEGAAREVAIQVIDTGPGIPLNEQQRVFEEFVRLGAGEQHGVGLGLPISLQLARAVGGRITVESQVGEGSVFTLLLPAVSAADPSHRARPGPR